MVAITSGAPTHRASPLGPQGESERARVFLWFFFGFKMRRIGVFYGLQIQVTRGWRGAQMQRGPLFGWQQARDTVGEAHSWGEGQSLRHGGDRAGSSISGCPLLRVLGPRQVQGTTSDACQLLSKPLPRTSSADSFNAVAFTSQIMLPGSGGGGGGARGGPPGGGGGWGAARGGGVWHREGPWIWGLGKRALMRKSLWSPFSRKSPHTLPKYSRLEKERATSFGARGSSGSAPFLWVRGESPLRWGRGHCRKVGIPPSIHSR